MIYQGEKRKRTEKKIATPCGLAMTLFSVIARSSSLTSGQRSNLDLFLAIVDLGSYE
jgi:hypothetical protein